MSYKASFRTARQPTKAEKVGPPKPKPEPEDPSGPSRVARQLALAHLIAREIEAGTVKNHSHASRLLGISEGHMLQVMNLLLLAPAIQERILSGELRVPPRQLRKVVASMDWGEQAESLDRQSQARATSCAGSLAENHQEHAR